MTSAPISPTRFASALKDLPLSSLHLKAAELRNSIAHLDYSNEQLLPFADGSDASTGGVPDQVCLDAIKENEVVIARYEVQIGLLKEEVEGRGCSWTEFQAPAPTPVEAPAATEPETSTSTSTSSLVNGTAEPPTQAPLPSPETRSSAWTDGTFQTGRIVGGEVVMNGTGNSVTTTNGTAAGGRLDDEALRRVMEERMRNLGTEDDEDEGMHL